MAPERVITEEDTLLFKGTWCRFARPARTLLLGETHGQLHLLALQSASEGFNMEDGRGIIQLKQARGIQATADQLRNQGKTVSISDFFYKYFH